jgi:hypothetical protein
MKTFMLTIIMVLFCSNVFAVGNCLNFFTQETQGRCEYFSDCYDPDGGVVWWRWCENLPGNEDPDTLYGFISGVNHDGVSITTSKVAEVEAEDYYSAIAELESGDYVIVPTGERDWFYPLFGL